MCASVKITGVLNFGLINSNNNECLTINIIVQKLIKVLIVYKPYIKQNGYK